jgi:2-methylisocitrate lyase-like PEP mutase family enzyme
MTAREALAVQAARLRALHHAERPLILPNAWDPASARAVERAGAAAIATTSSAVAESLGYPDGEAIPPAEMFDAVRRIAAAVALPVTADLESGYGLSARDLVDGLLDAGAVGLNLEDTDRSASPPRLMTVERGAAAVAAVKSAAEKAGVPIVINARVDSYLRLEGSAEELLADALSRGLAYRAAGADCIYPIWLTDEHAIATLVRELGCPVNVLLRPGAPGIDRLTRLGVRRISVGGGLARHAVARTEAVARGLLAGHGSAFQEIGED